ncbi:MAG: NUDIX domain-containing protein [Candidatus Melainabacteria bacterium]|nr:MAG: NUDIX domain-containing protein [Candidatus Melainabacteria bacterium]
MHDTILLLAICVVTFVGGNYLRRKIVNSLFTLYTVGIGLAVMFALIFLDTSFSISLQGFIWTVGCMLLGSTACEKSGKARLFVEARHSYRYCPCCSSALILRRRESEVPKLSCPTCNYVYWNNPIIAGVAVIPSKDGKSILLVRRKGKDPKQAEAWVLPGERSDTEELPESTVVREVKLQTGIDIEIQRTLDVAGYPENNQVVIFYEAKPVDSKHLPTSAEFADAKFFSIDALPTMAFELHNHAVAIFKRSPKASN